MTKAKSYILLGVIILFYSLGSILSKLAAGYEIFSLPFCLLYGGTFVILFVYALVWQQILKNVKLMVAYMSRAALLILGMLWGALMFAETIKWNMILGAAAIIIGIVLMVARSE